MLRDFKLTEEIISRLSDPEFAREWIKVSDEELARETQKRERFEEEVWCAHKWLDDRGVPRADVGGEIFSLVGRMMRLRNLDT